MELSENAINTLLNCKIINTLNTETLKLLLKLLISQTYDQKNLKAIAHTSNTSVSTINEAYTNIVSLFVEATKYNYITEKLNNRLSNTGIQKSHVEQLCEAYRICKQQTYNKLQSIGNALPHIVNIDWRLDYNVKSSTNYSTGLLCYHICLTTTRYNEVKFIKFTCTIQQLQELIHKLKGAVRHMEKLSTT